MGLSDVWLTLSSNRFPFYRSKPSPYENPLHFPTPKRAGCSSVTSSFYFFPPDLPPPPFIDERQRMDECFNRESNRLIVASAFLVSRCRLYLFSVVLSTERLSPKEMQIMFPISFLLIFHPVPWKRAN